MTRESELEAIHQTLPRFAMLQLRNGSAAEDVVAVTLLAILEKPDNFEGRSSLRTYATGIPKFKIIDVIRKRGREAHMNRWTSKAWTTPCSPRTATGPNRRVPDRSPTRRCSRASSSTPRRPA